MVDFSIVNRRIKTGREEADGRKWVTPVRWTSKRGHVITVDGTVWLFGVVPPVPQLWRDSGQHLTDAVPLAETLAEIGQTSKTSHLPGMSVNRYRRIALLVHSWLEEIDALPDDSPDLAEFKRELYKGPDGRMLLAKRRSVLIGVMLRPAVIKNVFRQVHEYFNAAGRRILGASEQILELYADDTDEMQAIFARHGMNVPTSTQFRWLDAWYNDGKNPDIEIVEYPDRLLVGSDALEVLALQHFDTETMSSDQRWIGEILNAPQGPMCLAAFGTLEPADEARTRTRKAARRTRRQAETGAEIGDEERGEHQTQYQAAKELEDFFIGRSEPWVTQASVLIGRRRPQTSTSFIDQVRQAHGIEFLSLTGSQHLALTETCLGPRHANPYQQDLSISHLANTGIIGFETLGDPTGIDIGISIEGDPVHLDPALSGKTSRAPIMPLFAATGSGKAQPDDEEVLTPTGRARMGDLEVGDRVIGSAGRPITVLGVFPQGVRPIWRVTLTDGSSVECDEEHLWAVRDPAGGWKARPLSELRELLIAGPGRTDLQIPMVDPVHFDRPPSGPLEQPYRLGVAAAAAGSIPGSPATIPARYLNGPVDDRVALLQGILDAAGRPGHRRGQLTLTTSSSRLANDVVELVELLGGTARKAKTAHPGLDRRLKLRLPAWIRPFQDPTKAARYRPGPGPYRAIAQVDYVGDKPARCILVDADDHLYVTRHGIVTHNTFLLQTMAVQLALAGWFTPFVNPKAGSDLSPMVELVPGGRCHNLTDFIGKDGKTGALDPFSFAEPERAASILSDFILTFFHGLFGGDDPVYYALRDKVRTGLQLAAAGGSRCAWDAIQAIDWPGGAEDERLAILTTSLRTNPLFALAIGTEPQTQTGLGDTLTLIQYGDYDVPMPPVTSTPDQYEDTQWFGVAVTQLIMTYCTELIRKKLSGALIFDEATILTASQIGRDTIDRFGRLFRESGGLLVVATQRPSDLLNATIDVTESHSRTVTGHLKSEREMIAAANFMGLNVESASENAERARFFAQAGPVEPQPGKPGRAPWFVHEDLTGRVSQLQVAVPEAVRLRFSTRPDEKLARRNAYEAAEVAQAAVAAAAADDDLDPALLIPTPTNGD